MKLYDTQKHIIIKDAPKWWKNWFKLVRDLGINAEVPVTKPFQPDWAIMAIIPEFLYHFAYLKNMYELFKNEFKIMFVETYNNKWVWKRYNMNGKVVYMSPIFDSEREARYDFENNGQKITDNY
jgi:hypothetical protein